MTNLKLLRFFLLALNGLQDILGSPQPLVSSSGMMPLHPKKISRTPEKPNDQTSSEISFSDKNGDVANADALSLSNGGEEKHVVKKSIPDSAFFSPSDLFNMNPDPETWTIKSKRSKEVLKPKSNQIAWRAGGGDANINNNIPSEPAKPQKLGTEKQFILHPFASGPKTIIKMPTNIITPSTTPMSELTKLIMETVTLPQMEELKYKDEDGEGIEPTVVMAPASKNLTENTLIPNRADVLFFDGNDNNFLNEQPLENLRRLIRKSSKDKTTAKPGAKTTAKQTTVKPITTKQTTKSPTTTSKTTKPSLIKTTPKPNKPPILKTTLKPTKPISNVTNPAGNVTQPGMNGTTVISPIDLEGEPKPATNSSLKPNILGPPWKNEYIVGKLVVGAEEILLDDVEVSFKVATRLCHKIGKLASSGVSVRAKRYFLWAPINQYVPLLRKAFPIRPPIFAPECLKFVLMHCRGVIKLPLLKPCTYWAPMPIKRPECGFNPTVQSHIVNYRLPEYVPGKCPCTWPCSERFDPIQRCRVTIEESERKFDPIHSDGEPMNGKELVMQDYLALQLCRGMKLALTVDSTIPIGWVPIRVDVHSDPSHFNHANSEESAESPSSRKRRSVEGEIETKAENEDRFKREQIFINPDKDNSTTSEESEEEDGDKDDRFALMNTYNLERKYGQEGNGTNGTTIIKCKVWVYRPCPRDDGEIDEVMDEWAAQKLKRRRKRSIPGYLSRFALGLNMKDDDITFWANRRFTRQTELDADEILEEEMDCGEWEESESYKCVPEQHLNSITKPEETSSSSSEENEPDKPKKPSDLTPQKRTVIKDLCPGSPDKFPCFLRRKRAAPDVNMDKEEKKEMKREAIANAAMVPNSEASDTNAPFLINKIMIQPDPGCMCDWPCLPFFDKVNKCYDEKGDIIVDKMGRNKIGLRSFRKHQRDPVTCVNFVETDKIFCKIKD